MKTLCRSLAVLLLPVCVLTRTEAQTYSWSNFAGTGLAGYADGQGTAAQFRNPTCVALDSAGNLYVGDADNYVVRKITPAGVVSTLAGVAGQIGFADGTGSSARLGAALGITLDSAGNVYFADAAWDTIRKITPSGAVTTLAGNPLFVSGSADGTGSAARFRLPTGVAVDSGGNIYVTDSLNHTIRKVTPAGVVTTIAGAAGVTGSADGTGPVARFAVPYGIAIDSAGTLYVSDYGNSTIRKVTTGGTVSTFVGTAGVAGSQDGTGTAARFDRPTGLVVDSTGTIFVTEYGNSTVRKITSAGVVTTIGGSAGAVGTTNGIGTTARFNQPSGVAVDSAGSLYVADTTNQLIRKASIVIAPAIAATLPAQHVLPGSTLTIGPVTLTGTSPFTFQWRKDGTPISGATGPTLTVSNVGTSTAGSYTVVVTNAAGSVTSAAVVVTVASSRLINLSVRSNAGTGADTLIVGFNLTGTGSKPLLIRGVGPTLGAFGLTGTLTNPTLRIDTLGGPLVAQNDNWDASIAPTMVSLGAFALPAGSQDAALLQILNPGSYTAQIGGGTGLALVEVYDAGTDTGIKLANLSARTRSGTGGDVLIAGFVIAGDIPKTLLIRGVGPGLAQFGLTGVLADPVLTVYTGSTITATNDNWGGGSSLAASFTSVGAFSLPATSQDAALLVTLPPGTYTAQVSGANNGTGIALVEVYEIPLPP